MIVVHRYLRAVGFSKIKKREELQALINEVVEATIINPDKQKYEKDSKEAGLYICEGYRSR